MGSSPPSDFTFDDDRAQPWTATRWALKDLREWGLAASALEGTPEKLESARWEYEDLHYWGGEVDVCINSWTLSSGLWLGADVDGFVEWFFDHQLPDRGWNCEWVDGSTVSLFHSTLNALVALLDYQRSTGDSGRVVAARARGEEYLLLRDLLRKLSTGEPFERRALALFHPRRWFYGILPALDYFREASSIDGTAADSRMTAAVELIRSRRGDDGRWNQEHRLGGDVWFHVDAPVGEPSRWVTLQAQRVLDWWDGTQPV